LRAPAHCSGERADHVSVLDGASSLPAQLDAPQRERGGRNLDGPRPHVEVGEEAE
jgi:hypothetical protein